MYRCCLSATGIDSSFVAGSSSVSSADGHLNVDYVEVVGGDHNQLLTTAADALFGMLVKPLPNDCERDSVGAVRAEQSSRTAAL